MSLSAIPRSLRVEVQIRDMNRCRYCRLCQLGQGAAFHINHVTPKSEGGLTTLENLVLQCPHCSLHKSNKLGGFDPDTQTYSLLFHPLAETWPEHFQVDRDGSLVGKTAIGRVTVAELRMNDLIPRTARSLQFLLGLLD